MFEGTNYAFVVELEFDGNREKRFLFSKRMLITHIRTVTFLTTV